MAVKAVADIRSVRNILHNAVFFAELRHLQTAEAFGGRAVNGIKVAIRLLVFIYFIIDVLQCVNGKLPVLHKRFSIVQLLQFIQRSNAERGRCRFQQGLDFVMYPQMPAVETTLAVSQRVCRRAHLPQIGIGTDMQLPYQFQIIVQNLIKRPALLFCPRVNHRQMQADNANIETPNKYGLVRRVSRLHAAPLKPRRKERPAPHGADNRAIFLVHLCYIAFARKRKPVGIHRFGGTENPRLKNVLQLPAGAMQLFVV